MRKSLEASFATVVALGVLFNASGAGAAPMPITACGTPITVPGAWVVANNLTATGDCLLVGADFVSIDLAGFVIIGSGSSGIGIAAPDHLRGIAVRNGTVTGFDYGIRIGSPDSIVEGVRAVRNTFGIFANGLMRGNSAIENRFLGIVAVGGSVILDSIAQGGVLHGIAAGPGSTFASNMARDNAGVGITVEESSTAVNNTASGNGIGLNVFCPSNVIGNTATNNGQNLVLNGNDCNVSQNLAP